MKYLIVCLIAFSPIHIVSNNDRYIEEIKAHQKELTDFYRKKKTSPLSKKKRKQFKRTAGHSFFPIDETYRITADFEKIEKGETVQMATSTDRMAAYAVYGKATFEINGQALSLNIYQSHRLRDKEAYKNHLFLPFNDWTNGETSYGGGRYIDLSIPKGTQLVIDFNKAYNPYCAYSDKYSCPVPPKANALEIEIPAGIMYKGEE